jgi:hypothetical protein
MIALLHRGLAAGKAYAGHPDPRAAAANAIALLVASNQPFYPLYLFWLVSPNIAPAWFTFLSTPFFLAVPAVARRNTIAGRALLPLAGIGNTILSAWLFGVASAVEIFLIPCAVIALLVFRPTERLVAFLLAGMALGVYLFLHEAYGLPLARYSAEEYAALARLNVVSASILTGFVALLFSNILAGAEGSGKPAGDEKTG